MAEAAQQVDMAPTGDHGTPPRVAGLEDLPDELVLDILDHFSIRNRYDLDFKSWEGAEEIDTRVITLYRLSLVSRKLHRIVNPLLYSVLTRGATAKHRRKFLRTVIQRPDLGALVEEVRFSFLDWEASDKGIPADDPDLQEATKLVDFGDDALNAAFQTVPTGEHTDTDVALLFNQLPRLRTLEFEANETWFHTFKWLLSLVRRAAEKRSGPLSSLRHLKATYGNENKSGFNPLFLQDWAALPALKSIEVVGAWSDERDGGRPLSLPSNNNIETLAFWQSKPSFEFLEHALKAFGKLKAFHYSRRKASASRYLAPSGRLAYLQALTARQDTLEHITMLADHKGNLWTPGSIQLPMSSHFSFKNFRLLKRLELCEFFLMGLPNRRDDAKLPLVDYSDVFPPSLEVLRLECYVGYEGLVLGEYRLRIFEALLENAPSRAPNLRCIEILRYGEPVLDGQEFDGFGALVSSFGIAFDIIEWEDWKHEGLATAGVC